MRPIALTIPRARYAALHTESWTRLKWVAWAPHSVHHRRQVGAAVAGGDRAQVERSVAVGVRGQEVDRGRRSVDVPEQLVDPRHRRRRRPSDGESGVDGLDGAGR